MSCYPRNYICTDICEGCVDIVLCMYAYAAMFVCDILVGNVLVCT